LTILGHLPTRVGWVFEIGITKQIAALRIASCIGNERQKNKASQKIPGQDHCENCYVMLFSAKIGHFLDMAITICSPKPAIHALESGFCLKWGPNVFQPPQRPFLKDFLNFAGKIARPWQTKNLHSCITFRSRRLKLLLPK
jgi:hypothetical protein